MNGTEMMKFLQGMPPKERDKLCCFSWWSIAPARKMADDIAEREEAAGYSSAANAMDNLTDKDLYNVVETVAEQFEPLRGKDRDSDEDVLEALETELESIAYSADEEEDEEDDDEDDEEG